MPNIDFMQMRTRGAQFICSHSGPEAIIPAKGWMLIGPPPTRLCYRVEREPVLDLDSSRVTIWVVPE